MKVKIDRYKHPLTVLMIVKAIDPIFYLVQLPKRNPATASNPSMKLKILYQKPGFALPEKNRVPNAKWIDSEDILHTEYETNEEAVCLLDETWR